MKATHGSIIGLPPAIQLLLKEIPAHISTIDEFKAELKRTGLLEEVSRQAKWSLENFDYKKLHRPIPAEAFTVTPSGVLDPFSKVGKCREIGCRLRSGEGFARTIGLHADVSVVPDPMTMPFLSPDSLTQKNWHAIWVNFKVLNYLSPLIEHGVLGFSAPAYRLCKDCYGDLDKRMKKAVRSLVSSASIDLEIFIQKRDSTPTLMIRSKILNPDEDHPIGLVRKLKKSEIERAGGMTNFQDLKSLPSWSVASIRKQLANAVQNDLHDMLLALHASEQYSSVLLTGSARETQYLQELENRSFSELEIENWETLCSIQLPWIRNLSLQEVLILREEAQTSLPALRRMLRERLQKPSEDRESQIRQIVLELREQSEQVRAELANSPLKRQGQYELAVGALALTFVIYGLTTTVPAAATSIAAMIGTLMHLHQERGKAEEHRAGTVRLPAYALVKAKQIKHGPRSSPKG